MLVDSRGSLEAFLGHRWCCGVDLDGRSLELEWLRLSVRLTFRGPLRAVSLFQVLILKVRREMLGHGSLGDARSVWRRLNAELSEVAAEPPKWYVIKAVAGFDGRK